MTLEFLVMKENRSRRSRAPGKANSPSRSQIARERREIRSNWSPEQRAERNMARRQDAADRCFAAHIRFVQFLIAREAGRV
jgi:hypothetical protein